METSDCGAEKGLLQGPSKKDEWLVFKKPKLPDGFQERPLQAKFGVSGLPWLSCQCRGCGFDPWSRTIPHAMEQLSLCTTSAGPASCNY